MFADPSSPKQDHPLIESTRLYKTAEPCIMVIFGATGDLTSRKLLPALYNLTRDGQLPLHFACVGFARRDKTHDEFREEMHEAIKEFSRVKPIDANLWQTFSEQIFYHRSEFDRDEGYESLKEFLKNLDTQFGTNGNRLYYLATPPRYFSTIIQKLSSHGLIYKDNHPWSRVIIEKPFGHDLKSAISLQKDLTEHLDENQVYRIDHYLGKETVQNLLVFRFTNPIFESVWNNRHIDHVQITVAEDMGIGTRGNFFEKAGMLRDIMQNHMMQLLSLVAMEPPTSMESESIRNEKVKVMQSLRPFLQNQIDQYVVRGQYAQGYIKNKQVNGYREEKDVSPTSNVETFVAMNLFIDNWRWAGIPFYLRAGKRLPKRSTEISITFNDPPGYLFKDQSSKIDANILVIRIQPDEGISLRMNCKIPGQGSPIHPVKMNFKYESYFGSSAPEAYERLICDCMAGDNTLFSHIDEVLGAWKQLDPVLEYWNGTSPTNFPNYKAGTWGPAEADEMIARNRRKWRYL